MPNQRLRKIVLARTAVATAPALPVLEYDLDLQSYANNDPVGTLVDSSGNGFDATNATANKPTFKTDSGNYLLFSAGGGAINYLNIPDYTALITNQAQIYLVLQATNTASNLGRFLGESNQPAAYSAVFTNNLYEPFATTVRKDNKVPVPLLSVGFCVYRVVSRNGLYDMSVNGVSFFNTLTNTFSKATTNPFVLGYLLSGSDMKLKYLAIYPDNDTDKVSVLRTRFGI